MNPTEAATRAARPRKTVAAAVEAARTDASKPPRLTRPKRPLNVTLPAVLHPEQRIEYVHVQALTGWSRSKVASETKAGRFPQPERDGPRCTRWRAGDVLDFLAERRRQMRAAAEAA